MQAGPSRVLSFAALADAIFRADLTAARRLLRSGGSWAEARFAADAFFAEPVLHWLYVGDSLLHLAAAAHRPALAELLLAHGCPVRVAVGRRCASPLHYAADGVVTLSTYDAAAHTATVRLLIGKGADINAQDANGATPLHRAVRCRGVAAVEVLIRSGCDVNRLNTAGSSPLRLAQVNSGRGGTGDAIAKTNQLRIQELIVAAGGR